jgi:hypothetical protein
MVSASILTPKSRVRPYIYTVIRDRWYGDRFVILRVYETGGYLRLGSFKSREAARRFIRSLPQPEAIR